MYNPFQCGPDSAPVPDLPVPHFLVELPSWRRAFFGNLADLLLAPFRRQPALVLTARPAPFWSDVFVERRMPVTPFRQSFVYHVFIIVALWGFSQTWLARPRVQPRNPLLNSKLVYYPVSEYLPPIEDNEASPSAKVERKGEPAYARQRIVSLPRHPDNNSQTIVTPSPLSIHQNVPLPNIVAWTRTPAAVPAAVAGALPTRLASPLLPEAIAPPPEVARTRLNQPAPPVPAPVPPPPEFGSAVSRAPTFVPPGPVAPPPNTVAAAAHVRRPTLPSPDVIEPPPAIDNARPLADLNIARLEPNVAAPQLPVLAQQAMWIKSGTGGRAAAAGLSARTAAADANVAVPALPVGGGNAAQAVGQIVALGVRPITPTGLVAVPQGNRRGAFAAGPEGKPAAPGTPEIHGGGAAEGGGGRGLGNSGSGTGGKDSPLAGITVAAGPVNPGPVAAAGPAPILKQAVPGSSNVFKAALGPTRPADIARRTRPAIAPNPDAPKVEGAVFGSKKYYTMMLNMPNLTSTGGSWIIRFAELNETREKGELSAPVATLKVDPAYPPELRREGMGGVVVLYAVIHADGSVGEVRVLHSIDTRLDASARAALMKWRFRPATRNGNAVELEAVIQIPFKAGGASF